MVIEGLDFVIEIDKLKSILRQTMTYTGERRENTAEHSWHLATSVMALSNIANEKIQLDRAVKMALIHDIVEIDAGDTFIYDVKGHEDKEEREKLAAKRLFGLLPAELNAEFHELWNSFEKRLCPESRFVAAVDRFLPMMANYKSEGGAWKRHGIKKSQVFDRNKHMAQGSEKLWAYAQTLVAESVARGYLQDA